MYEWCVGVGDGGEIGLDEVVEDVGFEGVDGVL